MARRLNAPAMPAWVGDLPVFERTLSNGLKSLVLPRLGSPIVVCDLYYPVGSVDEPPGRTGLAHFVEHMLFKGTARFPKGQIDRLAFLSAGQSNAETDEDATHYWFTFPADRWEIALTIEADRMRGAEFLPREVEAERQVIAEERSRDLDGPLGRLDQTHLAVSYLVHPYRNPVLGWPEDLRRATVADLSTLYEDYYRPDGAVLVVVGAIDPNETLDRIEREFGGLPRGTRPRPPAPPAEPVQTGRRDFTLIEPDAVARGLLGWHSVPRGHGDGPALDVLSDLLACGRRARLWERLVERDRLATWIEAAQEPSRLAGQFLVQVEATAGADPRRVEAAIFDVIAELAENGPSPEELQRSRNRLEAAWRWEQEDVLGLASGLGQVALWGDWRLWQAEHRAAIAVSADDIRRVAGRYLVEPGLTAGWCVPQGRRSLVSPALPELVPQTSPIEPTGPDQNGSVLVATGSNPTVSEKRGVVSRPSTLADYRPMRTLMPNGMRLLREVRPGSGTIALDLYIDAGVLREAKPGVASLTSRLREEGTRSRSAEALFARLEDVGGTLDLGPSGVSTRVRAEDLERAVDLMADVVMRPLFPADALPWLKRRVASERRADRDDPTFRAEEIFRRLLYGDHPYGRDPRGTAGELSRIGIDDIKRHHRSYYAPNNSVLVAVGDFDPQILEAAVSARFRAWKPRPVVLPSPALPPRPRRPRVRRIESGGEQVHIQIGHLGVTRLDPDYDALVILDHILGSGPGFSDRLSRVLRDEMGLAYTVGGGMTDSADLVPGMLRIYVGTGPDQAERAVKVASEQIEEIARGAFSDDEVFRARQYLAGSWVFDFQTVGQRVERLLELERWGLPLDDPLRWPDRISAITPEEVRAAARRHIIPSMLARVEYGPMARTSRPQ